MARFFDVPQTCCENHDGQADPEEDEEASEVSVVAPWIEMRYSVLIHDGMVQSMFRLGSGLFSRGGDGLDGGRRIVRHWG
jgi:hypothetical protein